MNWNRLVRVEAPAVLALSLDAAKRHLNLDGISTHDEVVEGFIIDAIAVVDGPHGAGLCLIEQTWRLSLDTWPRVIQIPLGPVREVVDITYRDANGVSQTLPGSDWVANLDCAPFRIFPTPGVSWPSLLDEPGAIAVTFKCGFGPDASDVPGDLIGALKLIVADRFANRASSDLPPGAQAVMRRYRAAAIG